MSVIFRRMRVITPYSCWPTCRPSALTSTSFTTRLADTHSRHRAGAVIHPRVDGTSLAEAVVQTWQVNGPDEALVAADAALHRRLMTREELGNAVDRFSGHPRVRVHEGRLMDRADGVVI